MPVAIDERDVLFMQGVVAWPEGQEIAQSAMFEQFGCFNHVLDNFPCQPVSAGQCFAQLLEAGGWLLNLNSAVCRKPEVEADADHGELSAVEARFNQYAGQFASAR